MQLLPIIGAILTVVGSVFILLAAIGLVRMPDLYTRIQAGTKASTLGTILVLLGLALVYPAWALKLILLIAFVAITNPISSHVLARAAARSGEPFRPGTKGENYMQNNDNQPPNTEKA
jgi:multicomponent Na+:H+ antiporter subunit G